MYTSVMLRKCLALALFSSAFPTVLAAQQITYYDFDVPATTQGQSSYFCNQQSLVVRPNDASNALFCFNDGTGNAATPSFITDLFPPSIDPNGGNGSSHYSTLR